MKGDFTRGHNPDLQRAQRYRRVLLQQGRVLLDSDYAASVGAMDRNLRELGQDLGCSAGGSDYGFLVTPGTLYALFDRLDRIVESENVTVTRDYQLKYLNRYPSLHIEGTGDGGYVEIELFTPHQGGDLVIWCRSEQETDFIVTGQDGDPQVQVIASFGSLTRKVITMPATGHLRVVVDSGKHVWIGMIEAQGDEIEPSFWIAPGRFHFGGLIFDNPVPTSWPQQAFPTEVGFSAETINAPANNGGFCVAYIEGWERLHTHLHDRGMREEALGGRLDTSVRTEAIGQVKLLWVSDEPSDLLALQTAFSRPFRGHGSLNVSLAAAIEDQDPCALPIEGGYSGPDNRLYHFEVHVGGDLGAAQFKWSRDNGSELYLVETRTGSEVRIAAGTGLQDGDLVELLSDVVELGDSTNATYDPELDPPRFMPAIRQVGQLALLRREGQSTDEFGREIFKLVDVDSNQPSTPDTALYPEEQQMLLRRWHGRFTATEQVELEHGIKLVLEGSEFIVGDWWEWQARVQHDNDNGEFQTSAHGPERLFAPLAVLDTSTDPVTLRTWADHRFVGLCDLNADHISFDGQAVGTNADSVQEALVELYGQIQQPSSCCGLEFEKDPFAQEPDNERLANLLRDALLHGGVVCLEKGIYEFEGTLDLGDLGDGQPILGNLTIKACNEVVIVQKSNAPLFRVPANRVLQIEGLVLFSGDQVTGTAENPATQVRLEGDRAVLDARECMFIMLGGAVAVIHGGSLSIVDTQSGASLELIGDTAKPIPATSVDVRLLDCVLIADCGVRCDTLGRLEIDRSALRSQSRAVTAQHIEHVELRHSTLVVTPASQAIKDLAPNTVLGQRHAITHAAHDLNGSIESGYALATKIVNGGVVSECRFSANVPLFADEMWNVRISDSKLRSANRAVWINQAAWTMLSGLEIDAELGIGVEIFFYARSTTIERCTVQIHEGAEALYTDAVAIVIGPDAWDVDAVSSVIDCQIRDNSLHTNGHGVRVGLGLIQGLVVSGNKITPKDGGGFGYVFAIIVVSSFDENSPDDNAFIIGNSTSSWRGICFSVSGTSSRCVGNDFAMVGQGYGMLVKFAPRSVIEGNSVTLSSPDVGAVWAGIDASDCDGIDITANTVIAPSSIDSYYYRPLSVEASDNCKITENRLGTGHCEISDSNQVIVRSNVFDPSLRIRGENAGEGGVVEGNIVMGSFDFGYQESLIITEVSGTWRVSNNSVHRSLRIMPGGDGGGGEANMRATVSGNHAPTLQVGFLHPEEDLHVPWEPPDSGFETDYSAPHIHSAVIVMGNICSKGLIVNGYAKRIVHHNAVGAMIISDIPESNILIP